MAADLGRRSRETLRFQRGISHALRRLARSFDQRRLRVRRRPQADACARRAAVPKPRGILAGQDVRAHVRLERARMCGRTYDHHTQTTARKGPPKVTNYAIVILSVATRSVAKPVPGEARVSKDR